MNLDLVARFIGVDAGAGAEFSKFGAQSEAAGKSWSKFALGAVAAGAAVGVAAIDMADKFEVSRTQLEGAIENVGGNFSALKGAVAATDAQMQAFGFTNTETEAGLAGLVVATKKPAVAMGLMGLAADIARGRNMSLAQSTALLVKVETGHVSLLGRLGINTKDATGATITQTQAIQRLTNLYGGDANRFSKTFSGQLQVLQAQAQDLGKDLGLVLVPALIDTIHGLDDTANAVKSTVDFFKAHETTTVVLAGALSGLLLPALVRTAVAMGASAIEGFADVLAGIVVKVIGVDGALAAAAGEATLFDAALGPIALGLAAVGALAAVTWEKQHAANEKAKQAVDTYVSSLNIETNSLGSLRNAVTQITGAMSPLVAAHKALEASGNHLAAGILANSSAYKEWQSQLTTTSGTAAIVKSNVNALAKTFDLTRAQVVSLANSLGLQLNNNLSALKGPFQGAIDAATKSHHPLSAAAADFAAVGATTATLSDDITSLDNAWNLLVGNLVSADQARTTVINDEKAWKKAIDASSGSITNQTKLGQAARTLLDQTTSDVHAQADAIRNSGGTYAQAAKPIQAWIKQIESSGATGPFVKRLVAQLKKELAGLKGAGQQNGANLDAGLVAGMQAHLGDVTGKARQVLQASIDAMHKQGQFGSPSKVTTQYGKWLAEGLIDGWTGEAAKLKSALSTGIQDALAHLQSSLNNDLTKIETRLKATQSHLKGLLTARNSAIGSLQGSIVGSTDISSVLGMQDANGNPFTGNIGQSLAASVGLVRTEASDLAKLRKMGLSQALLNQISAASPQDAITLAQQILSGQDGSVASLNQSERLIQRYAKASATTVVESPAEKRTIVDARKSIAIARTQLEEQRRTNRYLEKMAAHDVAHGTTFVINGSSFSTKSRGDMIALAAALNKLLSQGVVRLNVK